MLTKGIYLRKHLQVLGWIPGYSALYPVIFLNFAILKYIRCLSQNIINEMTVLCHHLSNLNSGDDKVTPFLSDDSGSVCITPGNCPNQGGFRKGSMCLNLVTYNIFCFILLFYKACSLHDSTLSNESQFVFNNS